MDKQEVLMKLQTLNDAIATERQEFINAIAAKDQQIADLQSQLTGAATPSDLDSIGTAIDEATKGVAGIVP